MVKKSTTGTTGWIQFLFSLKLCTFFYVAAVNQELASWTIWKNTNKTIFQQKLMNRYYRFIMTDFSFCLFNWYALFCRLKLFFTDRPALRRSRFLNSRWCLKTQTKDNVPFNFSHSCMHFENTARHRNKTMHLI